MNDESEMLQTGTIRSFLHHEEEDMVPSTSFMYPLRFTNSRFKVYKSFGDRLIIELKDELSEIDKLAIDTFVETIQEALGICLNQLESIL